MAIAATQSGADTFLHVQTKRAGKVKGESTTAGYVDDINVIGWHWGLSSPTALGDTRATGRRSYTALTINKHVDLATTALMSALATNDEVKEAKLTIRRAGGQQEPFLIITLKSARIVSLQHDAGGDGEARETISIVFTDVEVEYRQQRASGGRGGSTVFNDTLLNVA